VKASARTVLAAALVASLAIAKDDAVGRSQQDATPAARAGPWQEAACGTSGVDVTVALSYDVGQLSDVPGVYVDLEFGGKVSLPDTTAKALRKRITSLLAPVYEIEPATQSNASREKSPRRVRIALVTIERGFPPKEVFKMRFDCRPKSVVRIGDFSCRTDGAVNTAGYPLPESIAGEVRCKVVAIEAAGSPSAASRS